ncbi:hypothetical protein A5634_19220 [Mycobacterium asiaticum]|uniref:SnoaL-like domain-containing protein n=1 Tax=Mycobacterium asiaticum TaxID=1790 RepID=A0A1A3P436_MYCAS|nr:nuclear transport factor 2 family protein [Mycobacterium asiaticum]OBK28941.1 hypothetical protein A5634_19220 [Mycobacterium asiaticum]
MLQTNDSRTAVETFVRAFGEGRLDDVLALLHADFVIHAAGGVPYSGDYFGAVGFSELIGKMMPLLDLVPSPEMRYIVDGDKVVLYYRLTFTARASGENVAMNLAEVFSVRDGLIVELDVFYKDPGAVAALL